MKKKQSSPVIRWHSVISGISSAIFGTRLSSRGSG